jgi:hypothetical protein
LLSACVYRHPVFCWLTVLSAIPFCLYLGVFLWVYVTPKCLFIFGVPNVVPITMTNQQPHPPFFIHPDPRSELLHIMLTGACFAALSMGTYFAASIDFMNIFCFKVGLINYLCNFLLCHFPFFFFLLLFLFMLLVIF